MNEPKNVYWYHTSYLKKKKKETREYGFHFLSSAVLSPFARKVLLYRTGHTVFLNIYLSASPY